jgi:hypothetical protein
MIGGSFVSEPAEEFVDLQQDQLTLEFDMSRLKIDTQRKDGQA